MRFQQTKHKSCYLSTRHKTKYSIITKETTTKIIIKSRLRQEMKMKTVAIFYATKGGMGDVGKFAIALAQEREPKLNVRAIALSIEESEGKDIGSDVDVTYSDSREKMEKILTTTEILKIDVADESAEMKIREALEDVDAVVTCLGNREPKMERWCSLGTRKVINAMKAKNVKRLVCLSSMGIGKDYLKTSPILVLWSFLLSTVLRSVRKDLKDLEKAVCESDLDFALVRPVGLSPTEEPQGYCDHLLSRDDGNLKIGLAKSDAASFMLNEALHPTIHGRDVTIGYSMSRSKKP
jgi:putative NADH-flavin reductase